VAFFDQSTFDLRCEWGAAGVEQLAPADVYVIVDVLSFTTCVDIALSRGAIVLPYRWKDDSAVEFAHQHNAVFAGARGRSDGEFSLSPCSLMSAPRGLRLVLPSPNGSNLAFIAMSRGATVMAACLRNASSVANHSAQIGKRITVIPAGERWPDGTLRPAVEDWIGAGAILKALPGKPSPEARAAIAAFNECADELGDVLIFSSSGRELVERGFVEDVKLAAEYDVSAVVPILNDDEFTDYEDIHHAG
jgi:2-phosphosulfolactate phosphatase